LLEQHIKVVQVTRVEKGNSQTAMMIVAALVIAFCCDCWGVGIQKSPRGVGRKSALEQHCCT